MIVASRTEEILRGKDGGDFVEELSSSSAKRIRISYFQVVLTHLVDLKLCLISLIRIIALAPAWIGRSCQTRPALGLKLHVYSRNGLRTKYAQDNHPANDIEVREVGMRSVELYPDRHVDWKVGEPSIATLIRHADIIKPGSAALECIVAAFGGELFLRLCSLRADP